MTARWSEILRPADHSFWRQLPDIRRKWSAATIAVCLLSSCAQSEFSRYVRKDLRGDLRLTHKIGYTRDIFAMADQQAPDSWQSIWEGKDFRLLASQEFRGAMRPGKEYTPMVMVSFSPGGHLANLLYESRTASLFFPGGPEDNGFALVAISDPKELNMIAQLAHEGEGFHCGLVEYLTGDTFSLIDDYVGPEFAETIKLPGVIDYTQQVDGKKLTATIQGMQDLGTRYNALPQGKVATAYVKNAFIEAGKGIEGFTVEEFDHANSGLTPQNSVIGAIPGTNPDLPAIVVGAHLDSIDPADQNDAPGADDDASGIAVLTELIRIIGESHLKFARTIEFHGYAAEEIGLVGSKAIAQDYRTRGRTIAAMLQLDMVAWSKDPNDLTIYLLTNDTSSNLRRSLKTLMQTYFSGGYQEGTLKAGTSDHRSWFSQGYNTVFPFEHPTEHNQTLHTPDDTVETIDNMPLAEQFVRVGLVFLAHHGGLVSEKTAYETEVAKASETLPEDLKIAVIDRDGESWDIAIAAPEAAESVESCLVAAKDATSCAGSLSAHGFVGVRGARKFFINPASTSMAVTNGTVRRFFAYSKDDELLFQRTVVLTKE